MNSDAQQFTYNIVTDSAFGMTVQKQQVKNMYVSAVLNHHFYDLHNSHEFQILGESGSYKNSSLQYVNSTGRINKNGLISFYFNSIIISRYLECYSSGCPEYLFSTQESEGFPTTSSPWFPVFQKRGKNEITQFILVSRNTRSNFLGCLGNRVYYICNLSLNLYFPPLSPCVLGNS